MVGCLPCAAAAGPPGIAVAAVGTVGYGVYKYAKPKKKIKKKKLTKKKSKKGGGKGNKKFKRNEIVRLTYKGTPLNTLKFVKYNDNNMVTLRFLNKNKNTVVVDVDRVKKIPKSIANTKLRQKTRRANLVRKKRGIKSKSKSSTLSLPSSEKNVDDLLKDMKL